MKLRRGFSDAELVEGGVDAERRAQAELDREQRVRIAMQSGQPELLRSDLKPAHLGLLEDTNGTFYRVSTAEQFGDKFDAFAAFIVEKNGDITFLESPASGPRTRAELDEQRARRQERQAQPRPTPGWMR